MSEFTSQLSEIRKVKHCEFNGVSIKKESENRVYCYDERKETLSFLRQVANLDTFKERMNKIEKDRYKLYLSTLKTDDIDHIKMEDFTHNYINDLYKYCSNYVVLKHAFTKWNKPSTIHMIKEILVKIHIDSEFLYELIVSYLEENKNPTQLITSTNLLKVKEERSICYALNKFYDETNTFTISFTQFDYIYKNSEVTPERFCYLVKKCSDKGCYTKCNKTCGERLNRDMIKDYKYEIDKKYKCNVKIDLLN